MTNYQNNLTTINFDNFTIRPLCMEDSQEYFNLINDNRKRLSRYFPKTVAGTQSLESATSIISELLIQAENKSFYSFIIRENLKKGIIGIVFIKDLDWNVSKAELGFFIDWNYEGKGIITKSVALIVDHCFHTMKLNKLFIRIAEDNFASRRVAEKNGFVVEGKLSKDFKDFEGKLIDMVYYGLIRTPSLKPF
jgi:RimJ/RimL family protein N-acetyltransferase